MHCYDQFANKRFVKGAPYTVMYRPSNRPIEDAKSIIAARIVTDQLNERSTRLLEHPSQNYYVMDNSTGNEIIFTGDDDEES